jgi:putative heme-binding domain-containing protein
LIEDVSIDADPDLRLTAAELFGNTKLGSDQLRVLIDAIQGDPLITPGVLLPMLERSTTNATSPTVVNYLEESIRTGWHPPQEMMQQLVNRLSEPDRRRLAGVIRATGRSPEQLRSRLGEFLPLLEGGSRERGKEVFFSKKAACSTCHRVGSEGGIVGPNLTNIGAIRSGHDLIESVTFPSSTIAQEFEQFAIVTSDGRVVNGLLVRQAADTFVVRDSSGAETRFRRDQVEQMSRQTTSLMPDGLAKLLTRDELRDLMTYLQNLR